MLKINNIFQNYLPNKPPAAVVLVVPKPVNAGAADEAAGVPKLEKCYIRKRCTRT